MGGGSHSSQKKPLLGTLTTKARSGLTGRNHRCGSHLLLVPFPIFFGFERDVETLTPKSHFTQPVSSLKAAGQICMGSDTILNKATGFSKYLQIPVFLPKEHVPCEKIQIGENWLPHRKTCAAGGVANSG